MKYLTQRWKVIKNKKKKGRGKKFSEAQVENAAWVPTRGESE